MRPFLLGLLAYAFLVTPLQAESLTLNTYYPSPSGNYHKLASSFFQLTPASVSAVEAEYKCSYDPAAGMPACPAGIVYYDQDVHTLVVSDGTHWRIVTSMCVPHKACSPALNCSSDDCGNVCGSCSADSTCSSATAGVPGSCGGAQPSNT